MVSQVVGAVVLSLGGVEQLALLLVDEVLGGVLVGVLDGEVLV